MRWAKKAKGREGKSTLDPEDSPIVGADASVQTQAFVVDGEPFLMIDRVRP